MPLFFFCLKSVSKGDNFLFLLLQPSRVLRLHKIDYATNVCDFIHKVSCTCVGNIHI
jgi:hypothetical protein